MKRPLVLGIGNPVRGDDGFGPAVIEWLRARPVVASCNLFAVHQLLPELVEDLSCASRVAFIDASVQLPAGRLEIEDVSGSARSPEWNHRIDPPYLLHLVERLHENPPPMRLYSVGGWSFDYETGLSEPLEKRVAATGREVESWIAE